ncbi:low affinity iron permease family protein [Cryobacterium sp. 10I1]
MNRPPKQCLAPPGLRVESTVVLTGTTPSLSCVQNGANGYESINADHQKRLDRSREMTRKDRTSVPDKRWSSRVLHHIGTVSEHAAAGLVAGSALVVWVAVGIAAGFPPWWENVLYIASSSVTVVMVFAIQHTQARQQSVTQRKLDELLRAQPTADDRLIALEGASDDELEALTDLSQETRKRALETDAPPPAVNPLT